MNLTKYASLLALYLFTAFSQANVITNNTWTINSSDATSASGTITDSSVPGFSADFIISRRNVIGLGAQSWSGGPEVSLLNANIPGPTPDSIELEVSFSNVSGGTITGIVSEFGPLASQAFNSRWTYQWAGGGTATLFDPDNQMADADNSTILTGGFFTTNNGPQITGGAHTWSVLIPTDSLILNWASPSNAFAEGMAFRAQVQSLPTAVPATPLSIVITLGLLLCLLAGRQLRRFT